MGQLVVVGALATLAALTVLMAIASLSGNTERAAQLSREIDALIDKIKSLFEGTPPPEVQEDLEKAKEALEKYRLPKKDPEQDPKYPPPLVPPNVGPQTYERDRKEECKDKKKKYGWGSHSEVGKTTAGTAKQSHHILQDKYFTANGKTGMESICSGYTRDNAPCIPLEGPSTKEGTAHYDVTNAQRKAAGVYERRFNGSGPAEQRPTYGEVLEDGMQQMATHSDLKGDPVALACLRKYIDDYFKDTCPDMKSKTELRIPWMSPEPGPSVK